MLFNDNLLLAGRRKASWTNSSLRQKPLSGRLLYAFCPTVCVLASPFYAVMLCARVAACFCSSSVYAGARVLCAFFCREGGGVRVSVSMRRSCFARFLFRVCSCCLVCLCSLLCCTRVPLRAFSVRRPPEKTVVGVVLCLLSDMCFVRCLGVGFARTCR